MIFLNVFVVVVMFLIIIIMPFSGFFEELGLNFAKWLDKNIGKLLKFLWKKVKK